MAYLDPQEAFEGFRDSVVTGVKAQFPLEGKAQTVLLESVEVPERLHPDNVKDQQVAKTDGRTWAEPVYGMVALKDNATGKIVERKKVRLAEIPRMTKRYSYIVGGQEYQVDNQWQLKPGAYARRRQQGDLEVQFNTQGGKSFDMMFDPAKKTFQMEWNKAKVPAYPVLRAMGLNDEQLEKTWGKEILDANKSARGVAGTLQRMYKADKGTVVTPEKAEEYVKEQLLTAKMNPDATRVTLGKPLDHVNGDALRSATKRLLDMQAGGKEDDRDSLIFKRLRTTGDFAQDKIRGQQWAIKQKMLRKLDGSATGVRDVIKFDHFNTPIVKTFNDNQASRVASQINPLEMVSAAMQTTVMGPGGIKSEHGIVDETKFINTSHFGYLDPINTPEGCTDSETEVFTARGWVRWPEAREDDLFACLVNGRMQFHSAHKLVAFPFSGDLYGLDTTRTTKRLTKPLKYLMTPGHRVWSRPVDGAGYRFDLAPEMHGKARVFQVGHAPYLGKLDAYFRLPYVGGNNSSFHAPLIAIEDWAEFMGWFLSEGNVSITPTKRGYHNFHVALFQSDLPGADGCARIEALLDRLPFTWHREERKNHRIRYIIACKQLALYLVQFGLSYEKFIPECVFNWSLSAREALLYALLSGDGRLTQTREKGTWPNEVYTTTSRELALGVERLIISLGRAAKISSYEDKREERYRDVYEVRIFQCPERNVQKRNLKAYFKQRYEGVVYCAEVPGGMLYMRRDGGIGHWTGNSKTGVSLRLPLGLKKVGEDPMVPLFNLKTNKMEMVPPAKMMTTNVILPDQMDWTGKVPRPKGKTVKLFSNDNELKEGDPRQAQYAMRYPTQVFNLTSNLIPFLHSTQGNRAGMAARHMEQAVSLKEREKPLVQVDTGFGKAGSQSFEDLIGKQAGHTAPIAGTIKEVKKDGIVIQGADGKSHTVQMYDNYPLTDSKSFLQSQSLVKPGDKVKEGQNIADTNYSKDGTLALGTNLRVAYLPYKGYNFEDGVVLSESAAKKLSSEHMQKYDVKVDEKIKVDPKLFMRKHPGTYTKEQLSTVGEDGVVRVGQKVRPGDPLVLATAPFEIKDRVGLGAIRKSLSGIHTDRSLAWKSDFGGEVVDVHKKKDGTIQVHVRSTEPMQIGDKISGRHGNKGICTRIVPDEEMPRTKDGKPIHVALNPFGVPGRINPSQIFETVAAKVAEKTGKTFTIRNFGNTDQVGAIQALIKKHGVTDTEDLYDPTTGHNLGKVTVGPQYMLKLVHQVEKKGSVRSGMSTPGGEQERYDINLQPGQGGHHGGQSVGSLGMYALLAHGAKANLREMQTFKSEGEDPQTNPQKRWKGQHKKVWEALQMGTPVPTPQPTFAFEKFTSYMKAAGVNMDKKGHEFILSPMTDGQVKEMSAGALPNPDMKLSYKLNDKGEPMPLKGGLFDEKITGGHGGRKWTHIQLAEPAPNPMFEKAIKSITGLKQSDYQAVVYGEKAVLPNGLLTTKLDQGVTGGAGIEMLLQNIDVDKELDTAKKQLIGAPATKVDPALKKVKYLQALKQVGLKPQEAYVLHNLPVIPPVMRPASLMQDGSINEADLNGLYSQFATTNRQLGDPTLRKYEQAEDRQQTRKEYYDGVRAIMGVGVPYGDQKQKGLLHQIHGPFPKSGFFQNTLNNRRQDLSMRSTIVPEPGLGLDEVGVPKQYALDLFKPFVVKQMVQMGHAQNALAAQKLIDKKDPRATIALEKVMEDRPVLLKRDPVLHKYGVQGFKPKLVEGSAIKINPLTCSGYNADFDGDTMSMYVPVTEEAQQEARKMMPSNNLFSEASGRMMYSPTHEGAAGLYRLGLTTKKPVTKVKSPGEAIEMVRKGTLTINDKVSFGKTVTTPGRVLISSALPEPMQQKVLTDMKMSFDKKGVANVLSEVGVKFKSDFGLVANRLNDLGNGTAFGVAPILSSDQLGEDALDPKKRAWVPTGATTLSLADFAPDKKVRDRLLAAAQKKVQQIHSTSLSKGEKERRVVSAWAAADKTINALHEAGLKGKMPSNLRVMKEGAGKPSPDQYKQLATAPMLVQDTAGHTIPVPITKTFGEGVDVSQYWTGMYGARRGLVRKVQEVQDPGVLSKMMQNTAMDQVVVTDDCGTKQGIAMSAVDKDVHDRVLAAPVKCGKSTIAAGTVLTPDLVGQVRSSRKNATVVVRSPLKCQHEHGLCQKCMGMGPQGFPAVGTNVGVQATHALGEPTTQLMMKAFHCMHEHSTVLVREGETIRHTTLGRLYARFGSGPVGGLEVLDAGGWTRVRSVIRHEQHPDTAMVISRTRSGNFIISQDNHPHMLFENHAVCERCGTYPKRSNEGCQYYCRKCGRKWDGEPGMSEEAFLVTPEQLTAKSHRALLVDHPVTPQAPPASDGWLTGMYCAEGCVIHVTQRGYVDHPVGVDISQKPGTVVYEKLLEQMREEWAGEIREYKKGIKVLSTQLGEEYRVFGRYSRNKGLPDGWSGYPAQWKIDFVCGVIDGDGTKVTNEDSQNPVVRVDTTSPLLAAQVHYILRQLGIHAHVILTTLRKLSRHQGMAITFALNKTTQAILSRSVKVASVEGLLDGQREERFSDVVDYIRPFYFASSPYVYDLETESHTLAVNGIWTHNTGGVVGAVNVSDQFKTVENLLKLPDKIENQATLATTGGAVEKIVRDRTGVKVFIGGKEHFVGKDRFGGALHERPAKADEALGYKPWQPPRVGQKVRTGQMLTDPNRTVINPKELYKATGNISVVQNHLTSGLHDLFGPEGVRRVHSEVMVRAMTGTTRVKSAGDHPDILRGEAHNASRIRNLNKELKQQGKRPIMHAPDLKGIDTLPIAMRDDWMAKLQHNRLRDTLIDAAATGGTSNLHGTHPIPGLAYGAELGYNEQHSLRPGFEKYRNVKKYNY